jgi:hypothetical protein
MHLTSPHWFRLFGLACLVAALGACAATGSKEADTKPATSATGYQPVSDLPIPSGTSIKPERSLILGSGDAWLGRMSLDVKLNSTQTFAFYQEQMPAYGWQEITAVQGKNSILTYIRGERAATVEVEPGTLGGSAVSITVSPRKQQATSK